MSRVECDVTALKRLRESKQRPGFLSLAKLATALGQPCTLGASMLSFLQL